ncbi:hypothetical protein RclHR1_11540001 [Rhizophagus clarus]|uniref:Protein kinase domain-containing protein n=1 Tax=Rhizophagus clarus TaxID=94130 RepID=A0A2Z6QJN1_9GLOM|nr:hypothetical protein RclHR1_11540001 [Rhizophagus clarus]
MDEGICKECGQKNTGYEWCKECNAKHFQQNFKNWTSGNDDIDNVIQGTQLSAIYNHGVLEWIPYNKFYDIEYIAKGGFGKVFKAKWIDGYIWSWDNKIKNWERMDFNRYVALKSLYNSENVTSEFINEITMHRKTVYTFEYSNVVKVYGITQDPETKDYMMVMEYVENGSLRNYLDKNYDKLDWSIKLKNLWQISAGLSNIHINELIHRDLHIGNILISSPYIMITDMGLCKPANCKVSENTRNNIYGVVPYVAPEILRGQNYTKVGMPKVRCLDANPLNQPEIDEIRDVLRKWWCELDDQIELQKQIKEAEEINNKSPSNSIPSTSLSYETHSEAVYTSSLLNFNNLPEPKNSDDYYDKQNDDIIIGNFQDLYKLIFLN